MKIQAYDNYAQIASGNRITTANKDPAGLGISEKLNSQIKGDNKAISNIESSKDLLNTADGALNAIQGDLSRVRELAVQASNGTYTASDKSIIQQEINSLFENINSTAKNTEFNTIKLLDGSFDNKTLGAGANGQGSQMNIKSSSLESLGLEGFSVEGQFDVSDIDNALKKVTTSRSEIGAKTNGLESNLSNTQNSAINQTAARSTLADVDIAKAITDLKKQQALTQYQNMIQKKQQETQTNQLGFLI